MKRREFLRACAAGVAGAGLMGVRASAAETKVIRLGTLVPRGSSYFRHLQELSEKMRKAAGVSLNVFGDGSMGGDTEMVRRMRIGQLHAGMLTAVGLSEIEPSVSGLQFMPMMFRDLDEVDYITAKLQPELEKKILEKGFVVLFWADAGWIRFFSTDPVLRPADLKKAKLFTWAGSTETGEIYKSAGYNVVPLETNDILPGLSTGLINAVPAPPFIALAGQFDTRAPHMLNINWAPMVGATVVSKKIWESIPASARPELLKLAAAAGKLIKEEGRKESVESVEAMKKRNLKVHEVAPEIEAEWRAAAEAVYPRIRGKLVPAEMFDRVAQLLKEKRSASAAK